VTAVTAHGMDDSAVIAASRADPEQFAALYDRYAGQIYRYAYRRVGSHAAEDVVADTFLAAFRSRSRYDVSRADARPWLFGIATREISHRHRAERARYRAVARVGEQPAAPDGELADRVAADVTAQAARSDLASALATLSTGDRDVLLLVAWAGLSYGEISAALGIPVGTVRSRLHRARRKTRAALGGTDPTDDGENR
jgi:RNA polymerase sigma factor (sigma-70 family)